MFARATTGFHAVVPTHQPLPTTPQPASPRHIASSRASASILVREGVILTALR
jgi:hypothetical protein